MPTRDNTHTEKRQRKDASAKQHQRKNASAEGAESEGETVGVLARHTKDDGTPARGREERVGTCATKAKTGTRTTKG